MHWRKLKAQTCLPVPQGRPGEVRAELRVRGMPSPRPWGGRGGEARRGQHTTSSPKRKRELLNLRSALGESLPSAARCASLPNGAVVSTITRLPAPRAPFKCNTLLPKQPESSTERSCEYFRYGLRSLNSNCNAGLFGTVSILL